MNHKPFFAACLLAVGLAGCTTFGTNVNARFRCEAPDGVCAPSMVIDDSALARIEETTSTDLLNPAGPFRMDDGIDAPLHGPGLVSEQRIARAAPSYELAVVFPGYTDTSGAVHERRTVRTRASLPGRGDAVETIAMRGSKPARSQGLLAAAESAPPYLAIAPDAVQSAGRPGRAEASAAAPQSAPGAQAATATARQTAAPPINPITEIEAQVAEKLAGRQRLTRREAASFPSTPE